MPRNNTQNSSEKCATRGDIASLMTSDKHFAAGFWVLASGKLAVFTYGCPHPYVKTASVCDYI